MLVPFHFFRRKHLPPPALTGPQPAAAVKGDDDDDHLWWVKMAQAYADLEGKSFDWLHYQAITSGSPGARLFRSEFDVLPTKRIIKGMLLQEPWVAACANAISKQFLNSKFVLRRRTSNKEDAEVKQVTQHKFLDYLHHAGTDVESTSSFSYSNISDLTTGGDALWWTSPDNKVKRRLPVEKVDVIVENNRIVKYRIVDRSDLDITGIDGRAGLDLDPESVTHIRLPNPFSPHVGLSMFVSLMLPVLTDKYAREFVVGFFLRGGSTAGIIETDTTDMNRLIAVAKTIVQAFAGRKNMHSDKVLPKGATWKSNGHNFGEIKLVEMMKDNIGHFRAATGCTNTVLGIVENVNRATAYAELELFWKATILPLQRMYCSAIMSGPIWQRMGMDGYELAFDNSEVEWLDDFERRLEHDGKLAAVATINERRVRLGMPEIDRLGDKIAAEMASTTLELSGDVDTGNEPETAPAATDGDANAAANAVTSQKISLNGAQVTALLGIINQVALQQIPRDTGVAMIEIAFAVSREDAERLMGSVGSTFFAQPPASETPPPPANDEPADDDDPDDDGGGGTKAVIVRGTDDLVEWKAHESQIQEPTPPVLELFKGEFGVWQEIVLANLTDRAGATAAIKGRATDFAKAYAATVADPALAAYDNQATASRKTGPVGVVKEDQDGAARLADLRKRARDVIEGRIRGMADGQFIGYSDNAMTSVYDLIEAELAAGKSLTDVAASVRMKFKESYGQDEAYKGQAETIVRTEFGAAISIGQRQYGEDVASVCKVMRKDWVSMGDDGHTRESHLEAEGVPFEGAPDDVIDAKWANGLRFPRDPEGEAEEVINCRCTIRYTPVEFKE